MRFAFYAIFIIVFFVVLANAINKIPAKQIPSKGMTITSSAFKNGEKIPIEYTCQGQNINPPLTFSGFPSNTKSLVLIINDSDTQSSNWTHWLVWDIDPAKPQIDADAISSSFRVGQNSWGQDNYSGPCPPANDNPHHYNFQAFALDKSIGNIKISDANAINQLISGHILVEGKLVGIY